MESRRIPSAGVYRSIENGLKNRRLLPVFIELIRAGGSVFHNAVEMPVDSHVDSLGKSAMVELLDRIA
jgi:hypothetical protein